MKKIWIVLSLFPGTLWSQYRFDFEGGLGTGEGKNPRWKMEQVPGDRWDCDSVHAISGRRSLHHSFDNPGQGCDYFVINHDALGGGDSLSLSFRVRHGYPPSSANNWQIALLAELEKGEPAAMTEGIILGVNFKGSDDLVRLWRVRGPECEEICATTVNYQEMNGTGSASCFRLAWHKDGTLLLFHTGDSPGALPKKIASCRTGNLPSGSSLVIRYEYSAAQDRKLWIDDIRLDGDFVTDTIPPSVTGLKVAGGNRLHLSFSERIVLPDRSSFRLRGTGEGMVPDSLVTRDSTLLLYFSHEFPNREPMNLSVSGICDPDQNCLADTLMGFMRNEPAWGDVVINEVMYDPEPSVDLSIGEYLELYNRSGYAIDLDGWNVVVGETETGISHHGPEAGSGSGPGSALEPGHYYVLQDISLPNQGAALVLCSRDGCLVHAARYQEPYDAPDWKKEGGWSLESPDPDLACNTSDLWEFSTDRSGGTPGRLNSVDADLVDQEVPVFLYFGYGDSGTIHLQFSEPVRFPGELSGQVRIQPGNIPADHVVMEMPLADRLICHFRLEPSALPGFRIRIPGVPDCQGNLSREQEIPAGAISLPAFGSVLVNEIMYDPMEGLPEFIELYNPGSRFIDMEDLALDVVDEGTIPDQLVALSDHSRILGPGNFLVLTRDIRHLRDAYGLEVSGCWAEVNDLKSLSNSGGTIILTDRSGNAVDMVIYGDRMHMELIDETRGISLERIAWDRPGNDPANWHSAASIEGYATPGKPNSQSQPVSANSGILVLEPKVFSPDHDGFNDVLGITLATMGQGSVIRLWITDLSGNMVRNLANNHITGPEARYTWDGEQDDGRMAREGFYVIHVRGYHPVSGDRWNKKTAAGVIYP